MIVSEWALFRWLQAFCSSFDFSLDLLAELYRRSPFVVPDSLVSPYCNPALFCTRRSHLSTEIISQCLMQLKDKF